MTMTAARLSILLPAGALFLLLGGCTEPIGEDREFMNEGAVRSIDRFADAQTIAGARHDATLYDFHFDGDALNELGRQKLDLVTRDPGIAAKVIYLDIDRGAPDPEQRDAAADGDDQAGRADRDARTRPRVDAITQYLVDAGLPADQFRTRVGPNPATAHSAAASLAQMKKLESANDYGDSDDDSGMTGGGFRGNGDEER